MRALSCVCLTLQRLQSIGGETVARGSEAHAWIRYRNRALVLSIIRRQEQASRAVIEELSHLAFPSVTQICNTLIEDGLITETQPGPSRGGRRPILLAIRPEFGFAIGMKVAEGMVTTAVTDFRGQILARREDALDTSDADATVSKVVGIVEQVRSETRDGGQFLGVGIGFPGIVDRRRGVIRRSPLGWSDLPIANLLSAQIGAPVWADNDVNILAQGHVLFGMAQGRQNALVLTVGRGFGLGIVIGGQVYRGTGGAAAELGHIPWRPTELLCACGRNDCVECSVSDAAIEHRYALRTGQAAGIDAIRERARKGEEAANAVYREVAEDLARVVGLLVTVFAPELVIWSGEGIEAGPILNATVRERWRQHAIEVSAAQTEWVEDRWDNFHWARSAVSLVLDEVIFPASARDTATRT